MLTRSNKDNINIKLFRINELLIDINTELQNTHCLVNVENYTLKDNKKNHPNFVSECLILTPTGNVRIRNGVFRDKQNQILYIKFLADKLKLKTINDFKSLKIKDFTSNFGHSLLKEYDNSVEKCINNLIPLFKWFKR